jgi:hypothetical protein
LDFRSLTILVMRPLFTSLTFAATSVKKVVDVEKYYNRDRLRPPYESFESKPLCIMTSDY